MKWVKLLDDADIKGRSRAYVCDVNTSHTTGEVGVVMMRAGCKFQVGECLILYRVGGGGCERGHSCVVGDIGCSGEGAEN